MTQPTSTKKKRKPLRWLLLLALLAVAGGAYLYINLLKPYRINESTYIYIDAEKDFEEVVSQLKEKDLLRSESLFRLLAKQLNYPASVKTGRYEVKDGMNSLDVLRKLRSGSQSPVDITFNNIRTKEDLAARLSQQLMMDSVSLLTALNDSATIQALGFNSYTIPAMFIPNTYEVYWDISIEKLLNRMKKEHDAFWTDARKQKADKLGLTPTEISTLASIVEEEATYADEYPIVAGLYLNRLKKGMKLEADPTVKFAVGDPTLRRILFKHLEVQSPYNTYQNTGLPPGPIRVPSIAGLEACLNPKEHNYLFMVAKEDFSGRHNFAATFGEHSRNAAAYQRELNNRKIY